MVRYFLSHRDKVRHSHLAVVVKTSQGMIIMRMLTSMAPMVSCEAKGFISLEKAKEWLAERRAVVSQGT